MQENKRRRVLVVMLFFAVSLLAICGLTLALVRSAIMGNRRDPRPMLAGATVHTLARLPGDKAYPEALTIGPDGNIYVSGFCTGHIWRITPDGNLSTWYDGDDIGAASGLEFAPDNSLYVADRGDCDPRRGSASIKRISPNGQSVEKIGNIGSNDIPNALAFDKNGVLYLTDTQHGNVRRLTSENRFETWWDLPEVNENRAQPTGLAYDPIHDLMLVADTHAGAIYQVGFDASRNAAASLTLYRDSARDLDGLTVDDQGHIYITLFDRNEVSILEPDGTLTLLARDFREPSDVAYLNGVVYVTNFDSLSLAPVVGWIIDPSLPFTVDAITLPTPTPAN